MARLQANTLSRLVFAAMLAICIDARPASADRGKDHDDRSGKGGSDRTDKAAERADRDVDHGREKDKDRAEKSERVASDRDGANAKIAKMRGGNRGSGSGQNRIPAPEMVEVTGEATKIESNIGESSGLGSGSGDGSDNSGPGSHGDSLLDELDDNDSSGHGSSDDQDGDDRDDDDHDDDSRDRDDDGPIAIEYDDGGHAFRDRELVVLADDARVVDHARALGFSVVETRTLERAGALVVRLHAPEGMRSSDALALIRREEPDAAAGFNHVYATSSPDDRKATYAYDPSGSSTLVSAPVAIIDGFERDAVGAVSVTSFVKTRAHAGHGDAVSAVLLQSLNHLGGRRPGKLFLADVVEPLPNGGKGASVIALVDALDWAATSGASVVNLSLAGPDNPALAKTVSRLVAGGLVVVAAVGNNGPAAPPAFPAAYAGVIGVSAVDDQNRPYLYAGRGQHVDFTAQGVDVSPGPNQSAVSGTSFAAPTVTALVAALGANFDLTGIEGRLASMAKDIGAPGKDPVFGYGRLTPELSDLTVARVESGAIQRVRN